MCPRTSTPGAPGRPSRCPGRRREDPRPAAPEPPWDTTARSAAGSFRPACRQASTTLAVECLRKTGHEGNAQNARVRSSPLVGECFRLLGGISISAIDPESSDGKRRGSAWHRRHRNTKPCPAERPSRPCTLGRRQAKRPTALCPRRPAKPSARGTAASTSPAATARWSSRSAGVPAATASPGPSPWTFRCTGPTGRPIRASCVTHSTVFSHFSPDSARRAKPGPSTSTRSTNSPPPCS